MSDRDLDILPHSAGVLVVSDRASSGTRSDEVGPVLQSMLSSAGFDVSHYSVVPDERPVIESVLRAWTGPERLDLVVTTGGTGLGPRDVTPEAVASIADRTIEGIAQLMRERGFAKTPLAALSRQVAAQVGRSLVLALPGSPNGAVESLEAVIPILSHALDMITGKETTHGKHPPAQTPLVICEIRPSALDSASLVAAIRNPRAGGVVAFEGIARSPSEGRIVDHLYYEAYEPAAKAKLEEIATQAVDRYDLEAAIAVHATGVIKPGEVIVVAAAAAPHRQQAFEGAREIIERIKSEAPIWKKEIFEDGDRWVGSEELLS
jgi:molybdopterin adenylyltransferase